MSDFRAAYWLILAGCLLMAACSSDPAEESCAGDEDCATGEVCEEGVCEADEDDERDVGISDTESEDTAARDVEAQDAEDDVQPEDAGDEDTASTDVEEDTGPADVEEDTGPADVEEDVEQGEEDCAIELPCDRGVDDDVADSMGSGLRVEPEGDADRYGCVDDGGPTFVGVENRTFEGQTCADDSHRYRIRARSCTAIDFLVHVELKPGSDVCPVQDSTDVIFSYDLSQDFECEDDSDSECYEIHDTPEHGGYRWTVRLFDVFQGDETIPIDVWINRDDDVSVPYELIVDVEEI